MIRATFRVLAGFIVSCLVAGLVTVAFVITPAEFAALSGPALMDRLSTFGMLALLAATHSAIFAAPFALIAAVIGEWQSIRNPMYYAVAGVLIALGGFAAQYSSETGAAASIANNYALKAFLTAGFFAGLSYWIVAGRAAGDDEEDVAQPTARPKAEIKPTASVPGVAKVGPASASTSASTTAPTAPASAPAAPKPPTKPTPAATSTTAPAAPPPAAKPAAAEIKTTAPAAPTPPAKPV